MRRTHATLGLFLTLVLLGTGCATTGRHSLTWDALPFPQDSDWPGPKGAPAQVENGDLILQGQRVRTRMVYSAPLVIECAVELEDRLAPDGYVGLEIVPGNSPRDMAPPDFRSFRMIYRNPGAYSGRDGLDVCGREGPSGDRILWGEEPFTVKARTTYAIRLEVAADHMRAIINGTSYDLKGVKVPYKQFCIQLVSWQPTDRWHVRNFVVH